MGKWVLTSLIVIVVLLVANMVRLVHDISNRPCPPEICQIAVDTDA